MRRTDPFDVLNLHFSNPNASHDGVRSRVHARAAETHGRTKPDRVTVAVPAGPPGFGRCINNTRVCIGSGRTTRGLKSRLVCRSIRPGTTYYTDINMYDDWYLSCLAFADYLHERWTLVLYFPAVVLATDAIVSDDTRVVFLWA